MYIMHSSPETESTQTAALPTEPARKRHERSEFRTVGATGRGDKERGGGGVGRERGVVGRCGRGAVADRDFALKTYFKPLSAHLQYSLGQSSGAAAAVVVDCCLSVVEGRLHTPPPQSAQRTQQQQLWGSVQHQDVAAEHWRSLRQVKGMSDVVNNRSRLNWMPIGLKATRLLKTKSFI